MMKNQSENINAFEAFVQRVMDTEAAVGLAVSIVSADGTVLYEKCFGQRDADGNRIHHQIFHRAVRYAAA